MIAALFAKKEPETLAHLFWYCPRVQTYIADIKIVTFV